VGTQNTTDEGGGLNVGWFGAGETLEYNISVPEDGIYTLVLRVSTPKSDAECKVLVGDIEQVTCPIPYTAGWQTWKSIPVVLNLTAGDQALKIANINTSFNINWIDVTQGTLPDPNANLVFKQIPAKIDAVEYSDMLGVQQENSNDLDGAQSISHFGALDYVEYPIDVPVEGTYVLTARAGDSKT
jgi:hypothetical protein